MEVFLLNVMGSAAVASAVLAGILTTRLSREISGSPEIDMDAAGAEPDHTGLDDKP